MYFHLNSFFTFWKLHTTLFFLKSVSHPPSHIGYIGLLMPNSYKFYEVISLQEEKKGQLGIIQGMASGDGMLFVFVYHTNWESNVFLYVWKCPIHTK